LNEAAERSVAAWKSGNSDFKKLRAVT